MRVDFYEYDEEDTSVYIDQENMNNSSTFIAIENDDGEGIYIHLSPKEIQGFIDKLQKSLDYRKSKGWIK